MSPLGSVMSYNLPVQSRFQQSAGTAASKDGGKQTSTSQDTSNSAATKSGQSFLLVGSSNLSITKLSFAEYDPSEYIRRSIDGNIEVSEAIRHAEKPVPANDVSEVKNLVTSSFEAVEPEGNGFENTPIFSEAETTALVELYQVTTPTPEAEPELELIA